MTRHPFDVVLDEYQKQRLDVLEVRDAIETLSGEHERASTVLTLRSFGFTSGEIATQLDISISTVEADFRFARAHLRRLLEE